MKGFTRAYLGGELVSPPTEVQETVFVPRVTYGADEITEMCQRGTDHRPYTETCPKCKSQSLSHGGLTGSLVWCMRAGCDYMWSDEETV